MCRTPYHESHGRSKEDIKFNVEWTILDNKLYAITGDDVPSALMIGPYPWSGRIDYSHKNYKKNEIKYVVYDLKDHNSKRNNILACYLFFSYPEEKVIVPNYHGIGSHVIDLETMKVLKIPI